MLAVPDPKDFEVWMAILQGDPVDIPKEAVCGNFRTRNKEGKLIPVLVRRGEDGGLYYRRAKGAWYPADEFFVEQQFGFAVKNAVDQAAVEQWERDGTWPDDPPAIHLSNMPEDPFAALQMEVDAERLELERWLKSDPVKDEMADQKAANWFNRLRDLAKRGDTKRVEEKRPHDNAARDVQAKWTPLLVVVERMQRQLSDAATPYRQERNRKRQEALAAAAAGASAPAGPPPRATKTGLRQKKVGVILDYDAFVEAVKNYEEVKTYMADLANRIARARLSAPVPGLEIKTKSKAA